MAMDDGLCGQADRAVALAPVPLLVRRLAVPIRGELIGDALSTGVVAQGGFAALRKVALEKHLFEARFGSRRHAVYSTEAASSFTRPCRHMLVVMPGNVEGYAARRAQAVCVGLRRNTGRWGLAGGHAQATHSRLNIKPLTPYIRGFGRSTLTLLKYVYISDWNTPAVPALAPGRW